MWGACHTKKLILRYLYRVSVNMLKWARERVRMLLLHQAGHEDTIALGSPDVQSYPIMAAGAQRATRRLVAISSAGIDSLAACNMSGKREYGPTRATMSPRRPGVAARWKEQNRVHLQNVP